MLEKDLLVLVVDFNVFHWQHSPILNDFDKWMDQLLAFCHIYQSQSDSQSLVVIAAGLGQAHFLYTNDMALDGRDAKIHAGLSYMDFTALRQNLASYMQTLHDGQLSITEMKKPPAIAAALSMALAYINKIRSKKAAIQWQSRLLVINTTPDYPSLYVDIMNCIFCAQKNHIPIDCCHLSENDAPFLQQASYITGGVYSHLKEFHLLLPFLLSVYLVDLESRSYFEIPKQEEVNFTTSCFCHQRSIDIGYICSVCLSVFCTFIPVCTMCRTKFEFEIPR